MPTADLAATAPLGDLARQFRFNDTVLERAIDGLEGDHWLHRVEGGKVSHAQWILGHLAATRRGAVRLMGGEIQKVPWEAGFVRGTQPAGMSDGVEPAMLKEAFLSAGRDLCELLDEMPADQAEQPAGHEFPDGSTTREGAARFLYFHEVYHLGQLGLIRRVFDLAGVA